MLLESAFAGDVRRHLDFWTVSKGLQTAIESVRSASELELEGAREEECSKG